MKAAKSYEDLKREVWDVGTCSGCGACVAVCPADAICFDEPGGALRPRNIGYCKQQSDEVPCGACYYACPRTTRVEFGILGPYKEIISAKAGFEIPRKQTGGAVTAILVNAMQQGLIDAVVTVSEDRWTLRPVSTVITDTEELIHQAGSRYNWWVPLVAALKTAVIDMKMRKIAVIGVPCVVQAIHNIRESDLDLLKPFGRSIRVVVGLFCTETFDYNVLMAKTLQKQHHIDTWNIDHLDVRGGLEVVMKDGSTISIPIRELEDAVRPGCHYCRDLTAVFSDISVGAVGSPRGFSTLIIRNDAGHMFVNDAIRSGSLIPGEKVDIGAIERLGKIKIKKSKEL